MGTDTNTVKKCRHRLEWPFFTVAVTLSLIVFLSALGIAIFKDEAHALVQSDMVQTHKQAHQETQKLSDEEIVKMFSEENKGTLATIQGFSLPVVIGAPFLLFIFITYSIGKIYGGLRADGIKTGPEQFAEVHAMWEEMAREIGLSETPELYIQNGNGTLNAFATCVPGYRRIGFIGSDIVESALATKDEKVLRFVLGHELGHIRLGHVQWWYIVSTFAGNLPIIRYFVGLPLSRAREYGCDKVGFHLARDEDCRGLVMLAAGKNLYRGVCICSYEANQLQKRSIWEAVYNFFIDHPNLNWRIAAIRQKRHGDLFFAQKPSSSQDKPPH